MHCPRTWHIYTSMWFGVLCLWLSYFQDVMNGQITLVTLVRSNTFFYYVESLNSKKAASSWVSTCTVSLSKRQKYDNEKKLLILWQLVHEAITKIHYESQQLEEQSPPKRGRFFWTKENDSSCRRKRPRRVIREKNSWLHVSLYCDIGASLLCGWDLAEPGMKSSWVWMRWDL